MPENAQEPGKPHGVLANRSTCGLARKVPGQAVGNRNWAPSPGKGARLAHPSTKGEANDG